MTPFERLPRHPNLIRHPSVGRLDWWGIEPLVLVGKWKTTPQPPNHQSKPLSLGLEQRPYSFLAACVCFFPQHLKAVDLVFAHNRLEGGLGQLSDRERERERERERQREKYVCFSFGGWNTFFDHCPPFHSAPSRRVFSFRGSEFGAAFAAASRGGCMFPCRMPF